MKREIFFCKSWFTAKRKPTQVWTREQAQAAHKKGQPYTVLVDSLQKPFCAVTLNSKYVGIDFFDELLREFLTYQFQMSGSGKLFLSMVTHREFTGISDEVEKGSSYIFSENGSLTIRREIFEPYSLDIAESKTDVLSNFSVFPGFGEYDEIIRIER